jgi:hypothetical protein
MTPPTDLHLPPPGAASRTRLRRRNMRPPRARGPRPPALYVALLCAGSLWADPAAARAPRHPRAASTPSTAQILAPSAATVPDALPPDKVVYRCGSSYSARPCPGGATPPLRVDDARSEPQRRQAGEVAVRERRLASWLEAERRERDKAASAPAKGQGPRATTACVETAAIACVAKKARPRHAVSRAASGAAGTRAN